MINVDHISAINTKVLVTLAEKDFDGMPVHYIEKHFVDFVTNGPGAFEDYSNWREAWRDFVEFSQEEEVEEQEERVIGYVAITLTQPALLTAENQLALF